MSELKILRDKTKAKIIKIEQNPNINKKDKKILIKSYLQKYNKKKEALNNKHIDDITQTNTHFDEHKFTPFNIFEQFNNLNIMNDFFNKSFSKINISDISNINSNTKSENKFNNTFNNKFNTKQNNDLLNSTLGTNSYSYSYSNINTINSDGTKTVHENKQENNNGKILSSNNCYKIDKNGIKTKINCSKNLENSKNKKYNNFSNLETNQKNKNRNKNNYGKLIKVTFDK